MNPPDEWDFAADARHRLLTTTAGTLCTVAGQKGYEGHPYGSVVPYALDARGRPIIMLARMAAHTVNLLREPRATLFVRDTTPDGDPQASWRVGIMGRFVPLTTPGRAVTPLPGSKVIEPEELEDLHARYLERVPEAVDYTETHRFDYWRMETVDRGRIIAGFGRIRWVEGADMLRDPTGHGVGDAARDAIEHMNDDHRQNMVEMCIGLAGFAPDDAQMVDLDRGGFAVQTTRPSRRAYFGFGREITAEDLRVAVIDVLRRARRATAATAPARAAS